jgi:hypothetical protein
MARHRLQQVMLLACRSPETVLVFEKDGDMSSFSEFALLE